MIIIEKSNNFDSLKLKEFNISEKYKTMDAKYKLQKITAYHMTKRVMYEKMLNILHLINQY